MPRNAQRIIPSLSIRNQQVQWIWILFQISFSSVFENCAGLVFLPVVGGRIVVGFFKDP